jgi:hypothetical protein
MVRHIVVRDPGADELLALFTSRGGPVVELGTSRLTERMVATWPQADPAHARVLAEGLVRMAISHAGLPNADIRESTRRTVELLDPFIDRYLVI